MRRLFSLLALCLMVFASLPIQAQDKETLVLIETDKGKIKKPHRTNIRSYDVSE